MTRETKIFRAGGNTQPFFGHGTHTPWEEFQNTVTSKQYRTVMGGTKYPSIRKPHFDMGNYATAN